MVKVTSSMGFHKLTKAKEFMRRVSQTFSTFKYFLLFILEVIRNLIS